MFLNFITVVYLIYSLNMNIHAFVNIKFTIIWDVLIQNQFKMFSVDIYTEGFGLDSCGLHIFKKFHRKMNSTGIEPKSFSTVIYRTHFELILDRIFSYNCPYKQLYIMVQIGYLQKWFANNKEYFLFLE